MITHRAAILKPSRVLFILLIRRVGPVCAFVIPAIGPDTCGYQYPYGENSVSDLEFEPIAAPHFGQFVVVRDGESGHPQFVHLMVHPSFLITIVICNVRIYHE